MSASPRDLRARVRSLALLPLLGGLLLAPAAPAVAAPVGASSAPAAVTAADEPVLVPSTLDVRATSSGVGLVELAISVSTADGPVPAGSVSVAENGTVLQADLPVTEGFARYTATGVAPGEHVYTVTYSGTEGVAGSQSLVDLTVQGRTPASLTVRPSSPSAHAVDLAVTVSAAGTATVSGTVSVTEEGEPRAADVPVVDGRALVQLTDVGSGSHRYTVSYSGDEQVAPAVTPVDVTVRGETLLSVTPTSPGVGRLTLTIGVSSDGTAVTGGTVTISETGRAVKSGIPVSRGRATWSESGLKPGPHTYTVAYSGSGEIERASTEARVTVRDRAVPTLSVGSTSPSVGRLVLTVGVSAAGSKVSGGTVKISEGARTVKTGLRVTRGLATWSTRGLRSGRHTYTVRYSGTSTVKARSVRYVATVKAKVKPALSLSATSPGPKRVRVAVVVTAAGQRPLGGSVKVKEGSKTRKAKLAVKAGRATWSASGVKPGTHTYTVVYSGTSQVKGGSAKVTVAVKRPVVIKEFKNCTELNEVYEHGVGRVGAVDRGGDVTDFFRNTKLYNKNTKSDRDKDGIACEQ